MAHSSDEFPAINDEQFTIVHNDGKLKIYLNPSGEIFIKNLGSGAEMRMNASGGDINFTTFGTGRVEPIVVANSIGWRITKDK